MSHAHVLCTFSLRHVQTRTRMAQGVCSVFVISLHLVLCLIRRLCCSRGHFDTTFPSAPSSSSSPDPKARVKRTSARASKSLASWPIPRTQHEPWKVSDEADGHGDFRILEPAVFDVLSLQQVSIEGTCQSRSKDFVVNFWRFVLSPMVNSSDQLSKEMVDNL